MANYRILTDSTADLIACDVQELDVTVIPMEIIVDGVPYMHDPEGKELSTENFYQMLREGKTSTTSQIPIAVYEDWFRPVLEEGEDLLFICLSSGLTGSYNNASLAAKEMMEQFPERKVLVIDSLAATRAESLLVEEASALRKEGKSLEYVYNWVLESRENVRHWFTVDDLNHLKRGGRISAASALIGGMLSIKPIISVDEKGKLFTVDKVRGRKASMDFVLDRFVEEHIPDRGTIYVVHGDCMEDAEYCMKQIKERTGAKNVKIRSIGPVIGSHSGPSIVGIGFMGKKQ